MRPFLFGLAVILVLYFSVSWVCALYDGNLRNVLFLNGWILFSGIAIQLSMRLKTIASNLTPGSLPLWNKVHITAGFLIVLLFGLHTDWSLPDSLFEWTLWQFFAIVVVSGLIGAWINRAFPFRLDQSVGRIPIAEISQRKDELANRAEELALSSSSSPDTSKLSALYIEQLNSYFATPQNGLAHLGGSRRPLKRMLFQIQSLDNDADQASKPLLEEMETLVEKKNQLDFQYAHEVAMKLWLLIHLPATYGLIVLIAAHVVIVYAFSTGAP